MSAVPRSGDEPVGHLLESPAAGQVVACAARPAMQASTTGPLTAGRTTQLVLAAGVISYALLQSLVIPVMATIGADLHTDQNTATWILTAYLLTASIATPIVGRLGDEFGKRKVFIADLLILGFGSVLAACAPNIEVLIAARAIQGCGGGVLALAFGICRDVFPSHAVVARVGALSGLGALGGGLGVVLAAPIVDLVGYRGLFWIPGIAVFAVAALVPMAIPLTARGRGRPISWRAASLLAIALLSLVLGLSYAPDWGWLSWRVFGLTVAAAVAGAAWVRTESRSVSPLIDMQMMRMRVVWTTNVVTIFIGIAMFASFAFIPQLLETPKSTGYGLGLTLGTASALLLANTLPSFVSAAVSGRAIGRWGGRTMMCTGAVLAATGLLSFGVDHSSVVRIVGYLVLIGLGVGAVTSATASTIVSSVRADQTGAATGMNANLRNIGGAVGGAVMSSIVSAGPAADGFPTQGAYTAGFSLLAGACCFAAVAALLARRPGDLR